ncbi:MAG: hypothetical protein H6656_08465 [Ardenticatenaceae bacterium]|nr:hypothetical protein [Anaerolineales bacterium]MCB9007376.1 hypothetical protein [Ardenticatenaceae bacterium]
MAAKFLMSWDVRPETESEYFEFLVHEFIPGLNKLGISDIQVWYTQYGDCEQKLASGIADSKEKMRDALTSQSWQMLNDKLQQFVENFNQKVVPATGGFQV